MRVNRLFGLWAAMTAILLVVGQASAANVRDYNYAKTAPEVTAVDDRLVWRRCSEGQTWSGSACLGTAVLLTHEQALKLAQSQPGWRLPTIKELNLLTERSKSMPSINTDAFPGTPSKPFWTSTPVPSLVGSAWAVDFANSRSIKIPRATSTHVRLVRTTLGPQGLTRSDPD